MPELFGRRYQHGGACMTDLFAKAYLAALSMMSQTGPTICI